MRSEVDRAGAGRPRFPTLSQSLEPACSPRRSLPDTPNRCRRLGKDLSAFMAVFIDANGNAPSAPVASTILATLWANNFRDVSSRAAMEKSVSPQPPMATKILVSGAKVLRAESTLRSLGHSVRFESRNRLDLMKARATWVMGLIRVSSVGITSCCLQMRSILISICMNRELCSLPSEIHEADGFSVAGHTASDEASHQPHQSRHVADSQELHGP